jgi:hypothetical protein
LRAQESLKFDDERSGALGADRLPRRGILAADLFLDRVERGDARKNGVSDGGARLRGGGDDLAPGVRPACGQPQRGAACAVWPREPMIACISIDLQNAVEAFEDAFGMSAARAMLDFR